MSIGSGDLPKLVPKLRTLSEKKLGDQVTTGFTKEHAVIYDPLRQRLLKDQRSFVEGDDQYTQVSLKGTGTRVDIYIDVFPGSKSQLFLASIDLRQLGTSAILRRKKGKLNDVFVLGQMDDGWAKVSV